MFNPPDVHSCSTSASFCFGSHGSWTGPRGGVDPEQHHDAVAEGNKTNLVWSGISGRQTSFWTVEWSNGRRCKADRRYLNPERFCWEVFLLTPQLSRLSSAYVGCIAAAASINHVLFTENNHVKTCDKHLTAGLSSFPAQWLQLKPGLHSFVTINPLTYQLRAPKPGYVQKLCRRR